MSLSLCSLRANMCVNIKILKIFMLKLGNFGCKVSVCVCGGGEEFCA